MKKCILIEQSEDGMVSVGMAEKDDAEPPMDGYDMQPADNLNAAFAMAKDMLTSNPKVDAENEAAFENGYKKAGGVEELMGMGNKMGGME